MLYHTDYYDLKMTDYYDSFNLSFVGS